MLAIQIQRYKEKKSTKAYLLFWIKNWNKQDYTLSLK